MTPTLAAWITVVAAFVASVTLGACIGVLMERYRRED